MNNEQDTKPFVQMPESTDINIFDNSDGFRRFLQERHIEFKGNGSCTTLKDYNGSVFHLGMAYQKYKDSYGNQSTHNSLQ